MWNNGICSPSTAVSVAVVTLGTRAEQQSFSQWIYFALGAVFLHWKEREKERMKRKRIEFIEWRTDNKEEWQWQWRITMGTGSPNGTYLSECCANSADQSISRPMAIFNIPSYANCVSFFSSAPLPLCYCPMALAA